MIAIANKDNKKAISSNKKMLTYLKDDPTLSILLKAEVLKMEKKFDQLSSVYEEMIKRRNTETLGYRGLMEQNLNQQDFHHAFIYGEKLFFLNPKIEKLYDTLIYIIAKTKNWNQLLLITEKAFSHKIIERDIANENKSIAYYEIAKIKMMSDAKESMKLIHKALSLKKNFAPYIKLYLEILFSLNQVTQVKKLLKKYWSESPSSILRNVIADLLVANNLDDLELIKSVVNKNINHDDSKKLLIFFAIRLNNWELARSNIKGLLSTKPSRELCLFMADIEAGEFNDIQKSDAWKLRAKTSDLENLWICKITNQPQHEWESLSQSGYFNSLEWKQPKMLNQFIETA
jgi:HemY protein